MRRIMALFLTAGFLLVSAPMASATDDGGHRVQTRRVSKQRRAKKQKKNKAKWGSSKSRRARSAS